MATNKVLRKPLDDTPPQIAFANFAGDFNPTAANDLRVGADTQAELVLLNLANAAAAQSAKVDLGAIYADEYGCVACIEMQVAAATDGATVDFYWNHSGIVTAGTGNMGAASGAAAAYTGYSADLATALRQLTRIGSLTLTDDAVDSIQVGFVGILRPIHRWGSLIVVNNAGQVICDTDDVEAHIVLGPIVPDIQAAA